MPACAVKGCTNGSWKKNGKNIRFFSFPKDEKINAEWRKVCHSDLSIHARMCSEHFSPECYDEAYLHRLSPFYPNRKRVLKPDAVPTENCNLIDYTPKKARNTSEKKTDNNEISANIVKNSNSSPDKAKPIYFPKKKRPPAATLLPKNTPLYVLTNAVPITNNNSTFFILAPNFNDSHKLLPKVVQNETVESVQNVKHEKLEMPVTVAKTNSVKPLQELKPSVERTPQLEINKLSTLEPCEENVPAVNKAVLKCENVVNGISTTDFVLNTSFSNESATKISDNSQEISEERQCVPFDKSLHVEIDTASSGISFLSDDNNMLINNVDTCTKLLTATKQCADNKINPDGELSVIHENKNNSISENVLTFHEDHKVSVSDTKLHFKNPDCLVAASDITYNPNDKNMIIINASTTSGKLLTTRKQQCIQSKINLGINLSTVCEKQNNSISENVSDVCEEDKVTVNDSDTMIQFTNENVSTLNCLIESESQENAVLEDQTDTISEESPLYCVINDTVDSDKESQLCEIVNNVFIPETQETSEQLVMTESDNPVLTIGTQDLVLIIKELQNCKDRIVALEEEVQKVKNENKLLRARNELLLSFKNATNFEQVIKSNERSVKRNNSTVENPLGDGQESKIVVKQKTVNVTEHNEVIYQSSNTPTDSLHTASLDGNCNTAKDIEVNGAENKTEKNGSNMENETSSQFTNSLLTTPLPPQQYILLVNSPDCTSYPVVNAESFRCDICSVPFINEHSLATHKITAHGKKVSECKICFFFCENPKDMKEHILLHKAELKEKRRVNGICFVCKKNFPPLDIRKHLRSHSNVCVSCRKVFPSIEDYENHRKSHDRDFLCDMCGKGLRTKGSLISHMTTHAPGVENNRYKCDLCPAVYRIESSVRRHKLWVHSNQKSRLCNICGKEFPNRQSLHIHSKVHSTGRPYVCSYCGKTFKWSKNLTQHVKIHSNSNFRITTGRVKCEVCGKFLATKSGLHMHMKRHTRDPSEKVVCDLCGTRLVDLAALKRHLLLHTDVKPFNCKYCSQCFISKASRDNHERSHTGDKPYHCVICDKRFVTKGGLQEHSTIHSNDRPFKCKYCEKSFRRKTHLNIHIRGHMDDRRYECNFCHRRFIQRYDMIKHVATHSRKPSQIFVQIELDRNVIEENVIEDFIEDSVQM